jgi:Zn-dependent protease with chaperone function
MNSAFVQGMAAGLPAWVGAMTLATAILLGAALLLDLLLQRRVSASVRLWLYAVVVVRLAVPATWTSPLGLLGRGGRGLVQVGQPTFLAPGLASAPNHAGPPWLLLGYLAVVAVLLGRWLLARQALARMLRDGRPARPWLAALATTPIIEHPTLGPLMTGLWRPRIVLPSALIDAGDPDGLACVLEHERAHVARADQWWLALVQLTCAVAWPILPLWVAAARLRTLIELAADERALAGAPLARRRRYGEVLLALADDGPSRFAFVPSFGNGLRGRLRALATRRRWPHLLQRSLVAGLGLVLFTCAAPPDAERPQDDAVAVPAAPAAVRFVPPAARPVPASELPPKAQVRGSLDKSLIRGVIVEHINEVKACYEAALVKQPRLAGRVITAFTIGTSGQVESAVLHTSTMDNPRVENCIVNAVRSWQFPRPEGGIVMVQYPFVLTPSGG